MAAKSNLYGKIIGEQYTKSAGLPRSGMVYDYDSAYTMKPSRPQTNWMDEWLNGCRESDRWSMV